MCVYGIAVTVYRVVVFPSLVEIVSLETRAFGRFFLLLFVLSFQHGSGVAVTVDGGCG